MRRIIVITLFILFGLIIVTTAIINIFSEAYLSEFVFELVHF